MQINRKKIIKNISLVIVLLIVILLIILGIQSSEFGDIKKFDSNKSPRELSSRSKHRSPGKLTGAMKVTIESDSMANLGEFTFNISEDKKLIANISLKYKAKKDGSWFNDNDKIKEEILKKSVILRDATIDTMIGNSSAAADSDKMRNALKETLNKNLSSGEIEEVYFNKFIIQ